MPYQKYIDPSLPIAHSPCAYMRSKEMYVAGRRDTEDAPEGNKHFCWCNLTQHQLGPDNIVVDRAGCSPSRSCYQAT